MTALLKNRKQFEVSKVIDQGVNHEKNFEQLIETLTASTNRLCTARSQHGYNNNTILPNHSPEVSNSVRHGPLGCDIPVFIISNFSLLTLQSHLCQMRIPLDK
jgi:hypothetical protein